MVLASGNKPIESNAITTPSLEQAVLLERSKLLLSNIPATIVATVIVAPFLIYINWDIYQHSVMIFWGAYMALCMVYRYSIYIFFNKKINQDNLHFWNRLFLLGTVLTAAGWGITGSSIMLSDSLQQQMYTTVVLAGLSAGGLATLTPLHSIFIVFTLLNMTPLMFALLNFGSTLHYTTAALVITFMGFIITASARMSRTIHDSISLRFQHDAALKDIAEKKQQTDELNLNLRQQIHERQIIENHLEYSMSQLKATLESATDGILVIDNDEQVTNYNQGFLDLFNIPETLIEIADFTQIQHHISVHLKDKSTPVMHDGILLELDDGRLIEAFSNPQKINDQIIGNVLSYRDVTMRINSESALQQAKTKAEIANKEKSDFLSRISHELRTPLNAILGFGHLLQEDLEQHLDNDEQDYISHICVAGEHLLYLIDDLLDITRIEAGKLNISLSSIPCENIINESLALIQPEASDRNITVEFINTLPILPFIQADHTRCKQALVNLLSNAIKYNLPGGTVTLTLSSTTSHVRFEIKDTGIGIAKESFKEIFQPFIRLKQTEKTKGSGIGLTITKRLIDVMNGTIGVSSETGQGSTFWFELPKAAAQETQTPPRAIKNNQTVLATTKHHYTILYIEDEPLNQALLKSIVKQIPNTRFITASSGEEGIDTALTELPDLILMDINLPGISGYEVLTILRSEKYFASTPVFALSANAMPGEIKRGKEAGFIDYLIKPINIDNTRLLLTNTLSLLETNAD
ncbi:MAG: ATP-binding protein [Gammaproteobacteria bacterium]|nr:ATP-binding protein [Gammaproteobacteria bacterium]